MRTAAKSDDDDDHQEAMIGCDNEDCEWWFHYRCAGFDKKPSSRRKFIVDTALLSFFYVLSLSCLLRI